MKDFLVIRGDIFICSSSYCQQAISQLMVMGKLYVCFPTSPAVNVSSINIVRCDLE
jgi:hypothetical protein